jgi:hypothetical protein
MTQMVEHCTYKHYIRGEMATRIIDNIKRFCKMTSTHIFRSGDVAKKYEQNE